MDIQHTFEIYQKQFDHILNNNYYERPQVLQRFRVQFNGFSEADITILKTFLIDNDKKWFVAHLLDSLDTFPAELLEPMLTAAVNEPDPSFNNEFVKPCRRVFDYVEIQKKLLDTFRNGNNEDKIGVLKVLYWVRPTVYSIAVHDGTRAYKQKGYDTFFWDDELKSFNEDFEEDLTVFSREHPRQAAAYKEQLKTILSAFYETDDLDLKYQIALRLPKELNDYPEGLQVEAEAFLSHQKRQGIPGNAAELEKVKNMDRSFFRRLLLQIRRRFVKE